MKIVTVRIEDNEDKIIEVNKLKRIKKETADNLSERIDELQQEGFMQILAYIKCAYEDYIKIVGEATPINNKCWRENRLNVYNISHSVRICVSKKGIFIDFNYIGTLSCCNTPPRMEIEFNNNNIIIVKSTRNGINDLMTYWKGIKPKFQEEINKAYEKQTIDINNDISELKYLLRVAEEFKI